MRVYPELTVDGEFKALGDLGHSGTLNDRQFSFLRSRGYTNGLADMFFQYRSFSPSALFNLSEPGAWYDPSDLTTLFQDTAGTTPVTTAGQSVALVLDKSRGLVLGPELVTNGDFSVDANWTKGAGWTISGGVATTASSNSGTLDQAISLTAGRAYRVDYTITGWVSGQVQIGFSGGTTVLGPLSGTGNGTRSIVIFAVTGNNTLRVFKNSSLDAFSIDNISVRELPGNHATQSTAASRPLYGVVPATGRRNLLTYSEQFDNAAWAATNATRATNTVVAPDGTLTADTVTGTGSDGRVLQSVPVLAGVIYTFSLWVRADTPTTASLNGVNTGVAIDVTTEWQRFSVTQSWPSDAPRFPGIRGVDLGESVYVWGAQLETGSTATAYQRVVSAQDVTEAGVQSLSYLSFDGVDDFLVTPTINPSTNAQLGSELRGTGTVGLIGTATAATYNTGTGAGSVTRVDLSNQSFVSIPSLVDGYTYRVEITVLTGTILLRAGSATGTTLATLTAGSTTQFVVPTTSLVIATSSGTATFTLTSVREALADKAQVFAGVRKLSDAAGMLAEMSVTSGGNAGSFYFVTGNDTGILGAQNGYTSTARGTAAATTSHTAQIAVAAPDTAVLTATHDIAGDLSTIRRNGANGTNATGDKGTGNFLAYPLYIGRRGGTSVPLNGNIFSLVVRFGANLDAGTISQTETWVNGKTRAY